MKPRFSILTLLVVTLWIAVNLAALRDPVSIWLVASSILFTLVLVGFALFAAQRVSEKAIVARGVLLLVMIYVEATWSDAVWYNAGYNPPHYYACMAIEETWPEVIPELSTDLPEDQEWRVRLNLERLLCNNFAMLFGLLGGSMSLWLHRRCERHMKAP